MGLLLANMFPNDAHPLLRLYPHLQNFRLRHFPDPIHPQIINEHWNSVRVLLLQRLVPIHLIHQLHVG